MGTAARWEDFNLWRQVGDLRKLEQIGADLETPDKCRVGKKAFTSRGLESSSPEI
jgi:hypothetical protein